MIVVLIILSYFSFRFYQSYQTKKDLQKLEQYSNKRNELLKFLTQTVTFKTKEYKTKRRNDIQDEDKTLKMGKYYVEPLERMFERMNKENDREKHGMGDVKEYEFQQAEYDLGNDNPQNIFVYKNYDYINEITGDYKFYLEQQNKLLNDIKDISEFDEDVKEIKYILLTAVDQQIRNTELSFNKFVDDNYEVSINSKIMLLIKYKYDKLKN